MYGNGTQLIRAYHQEGDVKTIIFETMGNKGNRWQAADVPIGRIRTPFQLIVGARKSNTAQADIAIDDIRLVGCGVPQPPAGGSACKSGQFT